MTVAAIHTPHPSILQPLSSSPPLSLSGILSPILPFHWRSSSCTQRITIAHVHLLSVPAHSFPFFANSSTTRVCSAYLLLCTLHFVLSHVLDMPNLDIKALIVLTVHLFHTTSIFQVISLNCLGSAYLTFISLRSSIVSKKLTVG